MKLENLKIALSALGAASQNAHTALLEMSMAMYHYQPIWHLAIYHNGDLAHHGTIMNLDRVVWKDKTVDGPSIKVNHNYISPEDTFITLYELLSYDDYRRYLDQQFPVAKTI